MFVCLCGVRLLESMNQPLLFGRSCGVGVLAPVFSKTKKEPLAVSGCPILCVLSGRMPPPKSYAKHRCLVAIYVLRSPAATAAVVVISMSKVKSASYTCIHRYYVGRFLLVFWNGAGLSAFLRQRAARVGRVVLLRMLAVI